MVSQRHPPHPAILHVVVLRFGPEDLHLHLSGYIRVSQGGGNARHMHVYTYTERVGLLPVLDEMRDAQFDIRRAADSIYRVSLEG